MDTTKTTHTPGPWSATEENCGGGLNIVGPNGQRVGYTGEHRDKTGTPILTDEAKANGRMFAAAPDLLAACETSLRWLAKLAADHDGDEIALRAMKQHDNVRAAIAKAEGNA